MVSAIPGTAEFRYFWTAFQDFAGNKNGILLFVNKRRFLMMPRYAFTEIQWAEFRNLVTEKTKTKLLVA